MSDNNDDNKIAATAAAAASSRGAEEEKEAAGREEVPHCGLFDRAKKAVNDVKSGFEGRHERIKVLRELVKESDLSTSQFLDLTASAEKDIEAVKQHHTGIESMTAVMVAMCNEIIRAKLELTESRKRENKTLRELKESRNSEKKTLQELLALHQELEESKKSESEAWEAFNQYKENASRKRLADGLDLDSSFDDASGDSAKRARQAGMDKK